MYTTLNGTTLLANISAASIRLEQIMKITSNGGMMAQEDLIRQ